MSEDSLDYQRFMRQAFLEGVVRRSLEIVAREGFSGAHSFYITFSTDHPEVELAGNLQDLHPEQLTIVIEHQFRDLEVAAEWFSVTLFFGGIPHILKIPFQAVLAFSDPSVNFQLVFPPIDEVPVEEETVPPQDATDTEGAEADQGNVVSFAAFRNRER